MCNVVPWKVVGITSIQDNDLVRASSVTLGVYALVVFRFE